MKSQPINPRESRFRIVASRGTPGLFKLKFVVKDDTGMRMYDPEPFGYDINTLKFRTARQLEAFSLPVIDSVDTDEPPGFKYVDPLDEQHADPKQKA